MHAKFLNHRMFSVCSVTIILYSTGDTSLRSGDTFAGDSSGNLEPGLGSSQQGLRIDELERDSLSGSPSVGAGFKDLGSDVSSSGIPIKTYSGKV